MTTHSAPASAHTVARRTLLSAGTVGLASAAFVSTSAGTAYAATGTNPFSLGVASGDPWPDGFVIWTRLATSPLNEDGLGGMPDKAFTVAYQVAVTPDFSGIVRSGSATTDRSRGYAVHVTLTGLRPGTQYWYRFRVEGHVSQTGRAVTARPPARTPGTCRSPSPPARTGNTATSPPTGTWPRRSRT